jgi:hypothetical protein
VLEGLVDLLAAIEGSYRDRKARFIGMALALVFLIVLAIWLA